MRRLKAAGVIALGLLLSGGAAALVLRSDHEDDPVFVLVALLLSAWSFILGGLLAWARRPENRFGPLLIAVGLTTFAGALGASNSSLPFTLGFVFGGIFISVFIHALMAFPRGYWRRGSSMPSSRLRTWRSQSAPSSPRSSPTSPAIAPNARRTPS
jgi:hypothetical protein